MDKPTCKSCVYYYPYRGDGREDGECQRYPPQVIVVSGFDNYDRAVESMETVSPGVWQGHWCGEHREQSADRQTED